jgi:hypothetical protein
MPLTAAQKAVQFPQHEAEQAAWIAIPRANLAPGAFARRKTHRFI